MFGENVSGDNNTAVYNFNFRIDPLVETELPFELESALMPNPYSLSSGDVMSSMFVSSIFDPLKNIYHTKDFSQAKIFRQRKTYPDRKC